MVEPTAETVSMGASKLDPRTPPDERLSLVFIPLPDFIRALSENQIDLIR